MLLSPLVVNDNPDRINQWFSLLASFQFEFLGGKITTITKASLLLKDTSGFVISKFLLQAGTRAEKGFLTNGTLDLQVLVLSNEVEEFLETIHLD
jgi:hypothetical protein